VAWHAVHSVIKFSSESAPEWLRNSLWWTSRLVAAPRQRRFYVSEFQQHGDVLPYFAKQRCLGFGMKLCLAARPVQALELFD
jgi:hypothetical protein